MRDNVDLGQIAPLQATTALSSKQYSVRIKFKMCTDGDRRTVSVTAIAVRRWKAEASEAILIQ